MQAGDKLEFVRPFSEHPEEEISGLQELVIDETFAKICIDMLKDDKETIRSTERLESFGFVTVFEKPFIITAEDGSYLHIVVFGHEDNEGPLDLNICVMEHDVNHIQLSGYMYTYNNEGLIRASMRIDDSELTDNEDPHFSVLEAYEQIDRLSDMQLGSDDDEREVAELVRKELEEMSSIELWERELGNDSKRPSLQEIMKLSALMKNARPFESV